MNVTVSSRVFEAMQNLSIQELSSYTQNEIRPILPSLVRMSLLSPLDNTKSSMDSRKQILALLVGIEVVNNIVAFLQVNYHELEIDLKKEQQTRQKGGLISENQHAYGLQSGIALGFERADVTRKVRVVLSEIFYIQTQLAEYNLSNRMAGDFVVKQSELFEDGIYMEEIIDIICISLAELPSLLNVQELVDVLLYVNNGPRIICSIVANFPDCYRDVVSNLITNCDEDTPEGKMKLSVLNALSEMNPKQALSMRALCIDLMKVPSLMLKLSLKFPKDLIAFISGMLLGNDQFVRSWFAIFVRSSQKRKGDALHLVREELLQQLQQLVNIHSKNAGDYTVQAAALLRLYCALRGIAGIKFNEEEISLIMQLITTRPLPTQAGIRFVSLGLCMLIACPSLISNSNLESKAIEWMQWLIKEESYLSNNSGTSSSFGEMLLLMAIHFHSSQISAVGELVCSTLSMKIPIRPNSTSRIKQIFTQELFTEQVIAAHAVKVPVTPNLNANIPGYLPVHCIHQLLKSRAFLKHKVTIKSWIYKQICNCKRPLHPVMPALIEVYVNSLIMPNQGSGSGKFSGDHLHKPLSEEEILRIFKYSTIKSSKLNFDLTSSQYDYEDTKKTIADQQDESDRVNISCSLTSQLLILYYLVSYEDTRLCNTSVMVLSGRKAKSYSNEFLSELPMKYLLQKAQKYQHEYVGLFHPLLRLLVSNFPHLSMVDDWIEESTHLVPLSSPTSLLGVEINEQQLIEAFDELEVNPSKIMKIFRVMLKRPPTEVWKFVKIIVQNIGKMLGNNVPRLIQELYRKVWLRLNSVLPKRLWTVTVNAIMLQSTTIKIHSFVHENTLLDPLHVLRCNERVFRCPDILIIILRILQASLAASKAQLNRHVQDKPMFDKNGQLQSEMERDELKTALIASQESAAVHILLEASVKISTDIVKFGTSWTLREIRGIICSYIHQAFISEPSLAKLVHFQTYPRELLSMTVRGVPSMHICIDFLHEILGMPEMERQIFTIDLTSYLVLKYSIPKSLGVAKLCVSTVITLLGLLSNDAKVEMFSKILPAIVRFSEAFPVLLDDCITFLMQTGRSLYSRDTLGRDASCLALLPLQTSSKSLSNLRNAQRTKKLVTAVEESFSSLVDQAIAQVELY